MDAKEAYLIGQREFGVQPGDKVKVLRKAKSHENGWDNSWTGTMDDTIGKEYIVARINEDIGIKLECECYYPWFVLEIIEKKNEQSEAVDKIKLSFTRKDTDRAVDELLAEVDARIAKAIGNK